MLLDHESGATSVVDCSYATKLAVEPFPETLVEIDGSRRHHPARRRATASPSPARSGTADSDVSPPLLPWASRPWHNIQESVARDPAALGGLPARGRETGDLRRRQPQDFRAGRGCLSQRPTTGQSIAMEDLLDDRRRSIAPALPAPHAPRASADPSRRRRADGRARQRQSAHHRHPRHRGAARRRLSSCATATGAPTSRRSPTSSIAETTGRLRVSYAAALPAPGGSPALLARASRARPDGC